MARAGHLRSLLSFDRTDLEFLLLLSSGWDQVDLRPRQLASRRVALIDLAGDPELTLATSIAAAAASVEVFPLPEPLAGDPGRGVQAVADVVDAVLLADPEGRLEAWYEQERLPVVNLVGPSGSPLDVIGHMHQRLRSGGRLRGTSVLWQGEPAPALTSWVEATGDLPIHVTQVGGGTSIPRAFLARLRSEGQAGRFERASSAPDPVHIDARAPLSIRTRACAIAAALEFGLHTS